MWETTNKARPTSVQCDTLTASIKGPWCQMNIAERITFWKSDGTHCKPREIKTTKQKLQ